MEVKTEIENTQKKLEENARQIEQLSAMRENLIAQGNKLLGRLELLKEMEDADGNKD